MVRMTDTFTTPDGTYGATMKPNALFRWVMARQAASIRKGGQKAVARVRAKGIGTLVLIAVGRKSGRTFETPVAYLPQADGTWLVCASAGGAARHPAWYRNLAATPAANAVILGEQVPVNAVELHGADRDAAWATITAIAPNFLGYTKKTDRELPVIRLTRR